MREFIPRGSYRIYPKGYIHEEQFQEIGEKFVLGSFETTPFLRNGLFAIEVEKIGSWVIGSVKAESSDFTLQIVRKCTQMSDQHRDTLQAVIVKISSQFLLCQRKPPPRGLVFSFQVTLELLLFKICTQIFHEF